MNRNSNEKHYQIDSWMHIESEEVEIHHNIADAEAELRQCRFMSPEDRFEIVECDEEGKSLW